jgi:phosphohistidine phosphatase SixA
MRRWFRAAAALRASVLPDRRRILAAAALVLLAALLAFPLAGHAEEAVFDDLRRGGHVLLMRHALAPGTGDPAEFVLADCATQRNLSDAGRAQARRAGERLRAAGVRVDRVLSSRWCRALETARLLDVGPVEPFPPIDSFFEDRSEGPQRTAAVRAFLRGLGDRTVLMVTHQVNITALTGIFPRSGEIIVAKPDGTGDLVVVGRLAGF